MEEVLVFPSTHHMLRGEELLKRAGYALRLVPAPPQAGELCTTAIAVFSREREKIVRYLEGEKVLIKAVLPYEGRLERSLAEAVGKVARERTFSPTLSGILGELGAGKHLAVKDIRELLAVAGGEESDAVVGAAEAAARACFGAKVTALVGARVEEGGGEACDLHNVAAVAAEMGRQGFVYLVLDLEGMVNIPWTVPELKDALGDGVIALATASSLPPQAGELVREGAVRQILVRGKDILSLDDMELAEEIVFLRDNRPGPIGSGNLLPFLDRETEGMGREGLRRLKAVLAVCRLTLGDAFLPATAPLWREGGLAGANMVVLDVTARSLSQAVHEAEDKLAKAGLSFLRVGRGEERGARPVSEGGA